MDAYVYQAALFCEECALGIRRSNETGGAIIFDDMRGDSEHYPQGPYPDGGGEADCPQHCDACQTFLENPLTGDGYAYVREALDSYVSGDDAEHGASYTARMAADRAEDDGAPVLAQWARFYPEAFEEDTT